jgi:hypothetical protein
MFPNRKQVKVFIKHKIVKMMIASSRQWMFQNMSSHERMITKTIELNISSGKKEGA